ncbi:MAG: hypothetical protein CMP14_04960 [Rickettsiales bacterium]|nr:hypothetical protein [Rickettsiales bacterium]
MFSILSMRSIDYHSVARPAFHSIWLMESTDIAFTLLLATANRLNNRPHDAQFAAGAQCRGIRNNQLLFYKA